jgi:RNA polymerase sigma-70 factor (ECF subfamily)
MALRALGEAAAADDVAQEAIARVIGVLRSGGGPPIADLGAFIHGVARHIIADVQRARSGLQGSNALELIPDPRPDALSEAVSADERRRLRSALDSIPVSDRELLELCYVNGLGATEIAERLREPPERIRKRKSRAIARLREAFLKLQRHESKP